MNTLCLWLGADKRSVFARGGGLPARRRWRVFTAASRTCICLRDRKHDTNQHFIKTVSLGRFKSTQIGALSDDGMMVSAPQ